MLKGTSGLELLEKRDLALHGSLQGRGATSHGQGGAEQRCWQQHAGQEAEQNLTELRLEQFLSPASPGGPLALGLSSACSPSAPAT